METLVQKSAKLDAKNIKGDTPIHLAAKFGRNYPQVLMLMRFGVFMNIRNHECALKENPFFDKYDAKLRNFKVISYNKME